MRKAHLITLFFVLVSFSQSIAQCTMCKMAAKNQEAEVIEGFNSGIMYMMVFPYLIMATIGTLLYFRFRKKKEAVQ